MKDLFLEPFSGISGDMLNGLLIDLGADVSHLQQELKKLHIDGFHLHIQKIQKNSIFGTDFDVHLEHGHKDTGISGDFDSHQHVHEHEHNHGHHHEHRSYEDIKHIINHSTVSTFVKEKSLEVFYDIALAEANVHQVAIENIHFHEVGAIDSIVDIMSFFILWETLHIHKVYSTALIEGSGFIQVAHGTMPVPVPAVMQLRKNTNIPVQQDMEIKTELITPTGLAILKSLNPQFTIPNHMTIENVGYGFGKRETGKFNALRGSLFTQKHSKDTIQHTNDTIIQIETTIDNQTPEELGFIMDLFINKGVLDIYYSSIVMKKNRLATLLTLLIKEEDLKVITELLFEQTSTIGFRYQRVNRFTMQRHFEKVSTSLGEVTIKKNNYKHISKITLEYDDCKKIAQDKQLPISKVYEIIKKEL